MEQLPLQQSMQQKQPQLQQHHQEEADPEYSGFGFCCGCAESGTVHAIQTCGAYAGYAEPGLYWYIPILHTTHPVNVKWQQHQVVTDCKTKDNVQLSVVAAVQYKVDKNRLQNAVFKTGDPRGLIDASVQNIVRSSTTGFDLDDTYSSKKALSESVLATVKIDMVPKGYKVTGCLITDIRPDRRVLESMNQINASKRQREAAIEKGEAQKVLQVKQAEADAESKYLSGQGMARMRVEMAKGFKQSMDAMSAGGLSAQESMSMIITTQYVEILKDFASNPNKAAVMMPLDDPNKDVESKVRDGFVAASRLGNF